MRGFHIFAAVLTILFAALFAFLMLHPDMSGHSRALLNLAGLYVWALILAFLAFRARRKR